MMFRTPELFLGCLLTVAVFSIGMLFSSPHPDPDTAWLTKDAAGFFAFVLVIVGGAQALLSLPDREPRDRRADDQSMTAALFSTLSSSNSRRATRQSAFGTPARAANEITRLRIRTRFDVELKFIIGAGLR
jgi:hypothetical protein